MDRLKSSDIITLVLGGGAGTRLFPLTKMRSKPAVPLAGKYRLVDIPISNSINSGITRIFVLTQYNSASLNKHIHGAYRFGKFSNGFVQIIAAEQTPESRDWFQGTADAVRQSLVHLAAYRHSYVLILSGDQLYQMNYLDMLEKHLQSDAEITIATIPVDAESATGLGIMKTNRDNVVLRFSEKPSRDELDGLESAISEDLKAEGRTYLASMGIYIFDQDVLAASLSENPAYTDFGNEVIPDAIGSRKVVSYPFDGYWSDIGTIRSFYDANLELTQKYPKFNMYKPDMQIYTNARILPPAKIENSEIHDSLVSEGCVILNSRVINSVIGIRSYIGNHITIEDTVLMGSDFYQWHSREHREADMDAPEAPGIGAHSTIRKALIDKNVRIGERCTITNTEGVEEYDGDNYYIRDGIVVIPKNTVIADDTVI